jgi:hypothetical protein
MTSSPQDYKASARSVQRSSQELLSRLRDERLAKKPRKTPLAEADGPGSSTLPASDAGQDPLSASEDSTFSTTEGFPNALAEECPLSAPAENQSDRIKSEQTAPQADLARDPPPILSRERILQAIADAVERTPLAEALLTLLEETKPADVHSDEPIPVAVEPAITIVADSASPKAPTSLEHLTMIGPGLRWRLSQLGVESLDDLVAVDLAVLKAQLGEIGRLVNLTTWVNAARLILAEGNS